MIKSRRSISIIVFATLLLVLYLVVHIAQAQDAAPVLAEPTAAVEIEPTAVGIEPTAVWTEPTAVWTEPTVVGIEPTTVGIEQIGIVTPTENPSIQAAGVEENAVIPPASTELPPNDPILTLVSTEEPAVHAPAASITIGASMTRSLENNRLTLTVAAEGFVDVYDVTIACKVDPALLQGIQATTGDWLLTHQSAITDSGFQADGLWILLAKQIDSPPVAAAVGTLWTLDYQVVGTGAAGIACLTQASDQNNQPISLANFNPVLNIEISTISDEVSVTPTVTLEPTIMAVMSEIVPPDPTVIPEESSETHSVHVYGRIESRLPLTNATITISGGSTNQVIAVQPNGYYGFDLPAGEYQFTFDALYSLPVVLPVVLTGEPIKLPTISLIGGDVDENRVVDMMDAMLITQNFGAFAHLASAAVDLNEDGIVNIFDLVLVSASISP